MKREKAALITFGKGGHTVYYFKRENYSSRCHGYESPDSFVTREYIKKDTDCEYPLGTPVVDLIPALEVQEDGGVSIAFSTPMVNVDLPQHSLQKCPEPSEMLLMGLQGEFKILAKAKKEYPKFTGLDQVDITTYIDIWQRYGARIGKITKGGKIKWELTRKQLITKEQKKQLEFAL